MTDEEKKAIEIEDSISILENTDLDINNIYSIDLRTYNVAVKIVLSLVKKQSKELEEYKKQLDLDYVDKHFVPIERYYQLEKEIEELKAISEYREKIIKGLGLKTLPKTITGFKKLIENNDKKWEDKIKAKIEELNKDFKEYENGQEWEIQDEIRGQIDVLQSLLEKE